MWGAVDLEKTGREFPAGIHKQGQSVGGEGLTVGEKEEVNLVSLPPVG